MNAEIGNLRMKTMRMLKQQEELDQLMKLDELVQHADPRSIELLVTHILDDDLLGKGDALTPNKVRALIAFLEAEPAHLKP
jgi:hypothetical protein